jgi:hypothetical protein
MTGDVRLPDGRIIPELSVILRGARELAKLESEGMTVDRTRASAWTLGMAAIVADPPPPELTEEQRLLLAKLQQRNAAVLAQGVGKVVCTCMACTQGRTLATSTVEHDGPASARPAPEGAYIAPEILDTDQSGGIDHGQGGMHGVVQQEKRRARRSRNRVRSVSYVDPGRKNPMRDEDDD